MAYQIAYNLIITSRINPDFNTTYQNTLSSPYAVLNADYYDGLVSGATAAWNKVLGPPKTGGTKTFIGTIINYSIFNDPFVQVIFTLTDGAKIYCTGFPGASLR